RKRPSVFGNELREKGGYLREGHVAVVIEHYCENPPHLLVARSEPGSNIEENLPPLVRLKNRVHDCVAKIGSAVPHLGKGTKALSGGIQRRRCRDRKESAGVTLRKP